jgi:S1 RNA binding domain protein
MSLEVGEKVEGKITGLAKFGAFVDVGNSKTGLVHISEVSDKFVEDINDELSVGQVITVEVLSIADDGKIALSMRDREKEAAEKREEKKQEKSFKKSSRPANSSPQGNRNQSNSRDFDSLMDDFLKDSETRLSSLRKNTESKRGGRGGRRS